MHETIAASEKTYIASKENQHHHRGKNQFIGVAWPFIELQVIRIMTLILLSSNYNWTITKSEYVLCNRTVKRIIPDILTDTSCLE